MLTKKTHLILEASEVGSLPLSSGIRWLQNTKKRSSSFLFLSFPQKKYGLPISLCGIYCSRREKKEPTNQASPAWQSRLWWYAKGDSKTRFWRVWRSQIFCCHGKNNTEDAITKEKNDKTHKVDQFGQISVPASLFWLSGWMREREREMHV